jgi:alanine-glyoxylate transaminase/serine-glyoxylate transaminase/serine-pyruvate transaminase
MQAIGEMNITPRILLGPGPSNVHPRVLRAMSAPLTGHLDPEFLQLMEEVKELLRFVFQTQNFLTIAISGTGSAGMEACLVNLIEPGDEALVCVNGVFGTRMSDIVERCGGRLVRADVPWGKPVAPDDLKRALAKSKPRIVCVVHAETSTGAWTSLPDLVKLAHDAGALFVADTVTSLAGCPVEMDRWGVDAIYSGTQKCLSCPPGLSPVSFGENAMKKLRARKTKPQSWYLDVTMLEKYWGQERVYHHTAPITMNYALREALRLVAEEGLPARFARHERNHKALVAGLEAMGLRMVVAPGERLWMLNSVWIPEGVQDAAVRSLLLKEFHIEIGGGLGDFKGKAWRIGLMGESSTRNNVLLVLNALEYALAKQAYQLKPGAAVEAANRAYGG